MKKQNLNLLLSLVGAILFISLALVPAISWADEAEQRITSITASGNEHVQAADILARVKCKEGDILDKNKVEKDLQAIYKTGNFYDVSVRYTVNKLGVDIDFNVIENPIITKVIIEGNTIYSTDFLYGIMQTKEGSMLNSVTFAKDLEKIETKYREDGYVMAKVNNLGYNDNNELNIQIDEGPIVEKITAVGNKKTKEHVITRCFPKGVIGKPFNSNLVQQGMKAVYNTQFFEDVNLGLEEGSDPNTRVLVINIKEGKTAMVNVGGGYSSEDGLVGILSFQEKNYRGRGNTLGIRWEFGGDNEYGFTYVNPWMDRHRTSLGISIFDEKHTRYRDIYGKEHKYKEKVRGASVTVGRPSGEYSRTFLRLTTKNSKATWKYSSGGGTYQDFLNYYDEGTFNTLSVGVTRDTRDDTMNPRHGTKNEAILSSGGYLLGGDYKYTKVEIDLRRYYPLREKDAIALRAYGGWSSGHVPNVELFDIGGADDLRGYEDNEYEGKRAFVMSAEYRRTINKRYQAVAFADCGGAWDSKIGEASNGIKASVGLGMRVLTPMGPIRIDYGWGSKGGRCHFSFGQAF